MTEPINLSEWKLRQFEEEPGHLFTCGRPGRGTYKRQKILIDDNTINRWIKGLPQANVIHIVSLLGRKMSGFSEFGYYPFRSCKESGEKPTFQEWLDQLHERRFVVDEFPTIDAQGIPANVLAVLKRHILNLLIEDKTVVVMDSAGAERTARVCESIGYRRVVERSSSGD